MPLTAIISDIHGNHAGLLVALADAEAKGCSRVVCLGDVVQEGERNEEVIGELMGRRIATVQGARDLRNDAVLGRQAFEFLQGLPKSIIEGRTLFSHASPRGTAKSLLSPYEAWNVFDEHDHRLMFLGHLHIPLLYGERNEDRFCARRHAIQPNVPYQLEWNDRYIVSVGAIGYPRDGAKKIRYAIYDDDAHALEMRAIDGPLVRRPPEDHLDL